MNNGSSDFPISKQIEVANQDLANATKALNEYLNVPTNLRDPKIVKDLLQRQAAADILICDLNKKLKTKNKFNHSS